MRYIHMIDLEYLSPDSAEWTPIARLHAAVNKSSGKEYLSGGAIQSQGTLVFTTRYSKRLAEIRLATQRYRVRYEGALYKVQDYDDYLEAHKTIKLLGVSYHA